MEPAVRPMPRPQISVANPAPRPAVTGSSVRLRYTGTTSIGVRGPRSGRVYAFSGSEPERTVDGRDVEGLLKLGFFRRVR